jgi:hypothetical protein
MRLKKLGPVRTYPEENDSRFYSASFSSHFFLCLAGCLRLSVITRVAAGAIPELRAARRASTPASRVFFFRLFIDSSGNRCVKPLSHQKENSGRQNVNWTCKSIRRFAVEEAYGCPASEFASPNRGELKFPIGGP